MWEVRKHGDDSCPNQLQSQSSHLGVWGVPLGFRANGMVSSGEVSCIAFVMHVEYLLLHVMCVLMHVHVLVGVNVSVIYNVHSCMDTCTCMCSSDHIVVGAWPMAGTLWRLFEYHTVR